MPTHRHRRHPLALAPALAATALALLLAAAAPTRGQAPEAIPTDPRVPAPSAPSAPANRPECQATAPGETTGSVPGNRSLSDTLSDCGGALAPPPSGDREIAVPPPEGSRTPVIRPGSPAAPPPQPNASP